MSFSKISRNENNEGMTSEEEAAESLAMDIIAKQLCINDQDDIDLTFTRKRSKKDYVNLFWDSNWGKLIMNPSVENPRTVEGKRFRRRFRLPFHLFKYLVELCVRENIFDLVNKTPIPIEFKVKGNLT
jgi:hypothetical protein